MISEQYTHALILFYVVAHVWSGLHFTVLEALHLEMGLFERPTAFAPPHRLQVSYSSFILSLQCSVLRTSGGLTIFYYSYSSVSLQLWLTLLSDPQHF